VTPQVHRIAVADRQSLALDWYPVQGGPATLFVQGPGRRAAGIQARYFAQRFNDHGWSFAAPDLRGHGD
jgi:predicted alpha/beta hydrolase